MNCPDGLDICGGITGVLWPPMLLDAGVATLLALRVALYGGGAGVDDGHAVLGGGSGGRDAFDVLKYGLP